MGIVEGSLKSAPTSLEISSVYYQAGNATVYAVGSFNGIASKSLAQIVLGLTTNTAITWDTADDLDVKNLTFNKILRQGQWLVAIGKNSTIRESIDGANWLPPTGLAYTNTWGSLYSAAGNTFYLVAVGDHGAVALRNLTTDTQGNNFYNWQLLAANNSITNKTLRAVVNAPGTNEFLLAGDSGTVFKISDLNQSYTLVPITKDDPLGTIDPITKQVKKINFTTDDIFALGHNGEYYLALAIDRATNNYKIYRSTTGAGSSWSVVHSTNQPLLSIHWSNDLEQWLVSKTNAAKTKGGLLTSNNGTGWAEETTLLTAADGTVDTVYADTIAVGDRSVYLFGKNKLTLLGSTVIVEEPEISLSSSTILMPATEINVPVQQSVVITNSGLGNLVVGNVEVVGPYRFYFSAAGCGANSIAAGDSCAINVTFTPELCGQQTAELIINHNALGSPSIISLAGSTTIPGILLSPEEIDFGTVSLGSSAVQNVTITNTGTANLSFVSRSIYGNNYDEFSMSGCTNDLAPGQSCSLTIGFSPQGPGERSAYASFIHDLTVCNDAGSGISEIALLGQCSYADLEFDKSYLSFTTYAAGETLTKTITAYNVGTEPTAFSSLLLTGENLENFSVTGCSESILPGESCDIQVEFASNIGGTELTAQLMLVFNGLSSPMVINLSGTGFFLPPTYTITANTDSVNEGQTVEFTVITTDVSDNTILYWTTAAESGNVISSDFADGSTSGNITIVDNAATFTRTLISDLTTEGAESFAIQIRTNSINGNIQADSGLILITDSSVAPAPTPGNITISGTTVQNIVNVSSVNFNTADGAETASIDLVVSSTNNNFITGNTAATLFAVSS